MSDRLPAHLRLATVLVIDPSPTDRAQICDCLKQLPDVRVIAAGEAGEALEVIRSTSPNMILLDSTQKDIDGITRY